MTTQYTGQPVPVELALIEREEKAWEQVYLANRDTFRSMAREALDDLDAGDTLEMVIEDDIEITPVVRFLPPSARGYQVHRESVNG